MYLGRLAPGSLCPAPSSPTDTGSLQGSQARLTQLLGPKADKVTSLRPLTHHHTMRHAGSKGKAACTVLGKSVRSE